MVRARRKRGREERAHLGLASMGGRKREGGPEFVQDERTRHEKEARGRPSGESRGWWLRVRKPNEKGERSPPPMKRWWERVG